MTLSRHTSRIYADPYDINGACTALMNAAYELDMEEHPFEVGMYVGAYNAFQIILNYEHLDTQREFMAIFKNAIADEGCGNEHKANSD